MSKKDYKAIAKVLHKYEAMFYQSDSWAHLIAGFADMLEADNPRFSRFKFVEACLSGSC